MPMMPPSPIPQRLRERAIYRVTIAGSVCNLLLTLFKFFAGVAGHSAAMIADAVHSLSDLATDFVVLIFVRLAGKPQDRGHEFGHGKYETLATALIGLALLFVGLGICWNGVAAVYVHYHGTPLPAPQPIAFWAAIISIVSKELLYHVTAITGRRYHSTATIANAWHHRSDAFSSIGTALGVGGAILMGDAWRVLDPIAAIVVSIFIVKVSVALLHPSVDELLDRSLPEEEERFIISTILAQPGVSEPHHLRTRTMSGNCAIEVHFRMAGDTPLTEAHRAATAIENRLREHFGTATIINTHVEPVKSCCPDGQ